MGKLIGLTGRAGSGKDYTFGVWAAEFGPYVSRVAFADEVRFEIERSLGLTPYDARGLWEKPYPVEVRKLLQWWGTEYRRAQDPEYWVNQGRRTIAEELGYMDLVVVTDVRFANEADAIRDLGGLVVEVRASDATRADRLGGKLPPFHASEDIDFEVDGFVFNDGDWGLSDEVFRYLMA